MDKRVENLLELLLSLLREPPEDVEIKGSYPEDLTPILSWLKRTFGVPTKVAYLGPEGSYTHEAAVTAFPGAQLLPSKTISEVFEKVSKNEAKYGIVPIANRLEGPVNETIDNLFFHNLYIKSALEIPIKIVLASNEETDLNTIQKIYGHPMIFGQARKILDKLKVPTIPTRSTSEAALLAKSEKGAAALCSPLAASIYNLKILQDSVEDNPNNSTKFFVLSKYYREEGDYTVLLASVKHQPGGLYEFLKPFAESGVNLTMIYSRPMKDIPWHYVFYIELEGSIKDLKSVIEEARKSSVFIKLLGSYDLLEITR
ncbi:prephenate dehydratase [Ignicoccus islandicus]|nr:prephenate dehydratase [Ignicoccus islandicus]